MARILVLIAVGIIAWYLWEQARSLRHKPPEERRAGMLKFGFAAFFLITMALVVTGRAHWLAAAFAALLPLGKGLIGVTLRSLPLLRVWQRHSNSQFGPRIKTAFLEVKINLRNGHIDGKILQGEHVDQSLSQLDQAQLEQLLETLRGADREGAMLLQAYLARRFGASARYSRQQQQHQSPPSGAMSRNEALQILGLEADADEQAIIKAHKRLIQKLHPDRGGNDYLAAKINAAKDCLLKN